MAGLVLTWYNCVSSWYTFFSTLYALKKMQLKVNESATESLVDNNNTTGDMEDELSRIAKDMVKTVLKGLGNEAEENKNLYENPSRENQEECLVPNKRREHCKEVTEHMSIEEIMKYTVERDGAKEIFTIVVAGISAVVSFLYFYF